MKRVLVVLAVLAISTWVLAQNNYPQGTASQTAPQQGSASRPGSSQQASPQQGSSQQASPQQGASAAPGAAQQGPPAKHPPQAKSQDEYKAFQTAAALTDPAALEKAADDFAAKFPNSELKVLLYRQAMNAYQNANNADKMLEMGRKITAID